jgi:hypothetical protein
MIRQYYEQKRTIRFEELIMNSYIIDSDNINYKLEVKNLMGDSATMIVDYIDDYNQEAKENEQPLIEGEQLDSLNSLYYNEVEQLNGKHVIFGAVELFEQSDKCPLWYDRCGSVYSFRKV